MLTFLSRYTVTFLAAALVAAIAWGGIQTYRLQALKLENAEALVKAQSAARSKEAEWQVIYEETIDAKQQELERINTDYVRELGRLRNRSQRMPTASAPSCQGASGSELAIGDAEFLAGFAADAAKQQAALRACQAWVEGVTSYSPNR